jgi:hypothetical protein
MQQRVLQVAFSVVLRSGHCGKHISAAVNQHVTKEEVVFSVDLPPDYIMRISSIKIEFQRWQLQQRTDRLRI